MYPPSSAGLPSKYGNSFIWPINWLTTFVVLSTELDFFSYMRDILHIDSYYDSSQDILVQLYILVSYRLRQLNLRSVSLI